MGSACGRGSNRGRLKAMPSSPDVAVPPQSSPQVGPASTPGVPAVAPVSMVPSNVPTAERPSLVPTPPSAEPIDLRSPGLYLNRELSWIEFNARVLAEAENEAVPLLERLKFHAIAASNLDEFFMVRVAGLKQQQTGEVGDLAADGLTAPEQLVKISSRVHDLISQQMA